MATYLIGDIHGCLDEFNALLEKVAFNPQKDQLWLTGDLVARGKDSLGVLRKVYSLRNSVRLVLGNHDIHLLAVDAGIVPNKSKDNLDTLLQAQDKDELLNWLRFQPLLQVCEEKNLVMSHAGITPQWDLPTAISTAKEVEKVLQGKHYQDFLAHMYGEQPNSWLESLTGTARLRFITNAFTRMRFCFPNGQLDFACKAKPDEAPAPLKPWFSLPSKVSSNYTVIFGHWAALEGKGTPERVINLDTGCCWGGSLTLLHWETKTFHSQKAFS